VTPEVLIAREVERAAKPAERIAALEVAQAARITKLEEAAAALGYRLVPLSKAPAKKAAAPAE
jgi:hypothetical protein